MSMKSVFSNRETKTIKSFFFNFSIFEMYFKLLFLKIGYKNNHSNIVSYFQRHKTLFKNRNQRPINSCIFLALFKLKHISYVYLKCKVSFP